MASISASGTVFSLRDWTFWTAASAGTPAGTPVPAAQVVQALAAAGIAATYQEPRVTADGIVGAGDDTGHDTARATTGNPQGTVRAHPGAIGPRVGPSRGPRSRRLEPIDRIHAGLGLAAGP